MNKTVSIALAGFSFIIEEHAYIKLIDYLNALRSSLDRSEADEVMYDIEVRIMEIFKGLLGKREVISSDDVDRVIDQIGTPETIEAQEETYYSEKIQSQKKQKTNTHQKQLFRDTQNRKIAGVCSGLAYYIGIDIAIMRMIWVISLFLGLFPAALFYILFWVVMPKAETASDFLKMKGKPLDFDHIKDESIRFASESSRKVGELYEENKPAIVKAGGQVWNILRNILGFIFALISVKLVILSIAIVLGLTNVIYFSDIDKFNFFIGGDNPKYAIVVMLVSILLAFVVLFSGIAIKLISPKVKVKALALLAGILFAVFGASAGYFAMEMTRLGQIYTGTNREEENIAIANNASNKIELDVKKVIIPQNFKAYGNKIFSDKKRVYEESFRPDIYITKKDGITSPYLIIKKKAKGYKEHIRLNVPVEVQEGRVLFPNYIGYSYEHRLRDYDVSYELVLPRTMQVVDVSYGGLDLDENEENDFEDIADDW